MLTASNAREGLDLLANHDVGVVVADYEMPGLDGNEFLKRVQNLYPSISPIMVSGQSDMASLVTAVNDGNIYKFLEKPVPATELRKTLRDAFLSREPNGHSEATVNDDQHIRRSA